VRIQDALDAVGFGEVDGLESIVCVPGSTPGRLRNAKLSRVADADLADYGTIYVAGGLFAAGSLVNGQGRTAANVRRIVWLALDADGKDFLSVPAETLWEMPQSVLDEIISTLTETLRAECARWHIPLHRIDCTGYGIAGYVYIDPEDQGRLEDIRRAYRAIVRVVNESANMMLLDRQASDAGTRVTRIPGDGAVNAKGDLPRPVYVIERNPGTVSVDALLAAVGNPEPITPRVPLLVQDQELPMDTYAEIVSVMRENWIAGQRNSLSLGLAGILAQNGVAEDAALRVMEDVTAGDEERESRLNNVRLTYARMRSGLSISGWTRLRSSGVPDRAVSQIDRALAPISRATTATLTITNEPTPRSQASPQFCEPPDDCFRGWIGRYVELVENTTEASDAYHLGTALTVAGAILGRRAWCTYGGSPIYPNLFSLLVGTAGGSRKDTAVKRGIYARDILSSGMAMEATEEPYRLITDAGSSQGLIDVLAESPTVVLYLTELAKLTRNARRSGTSDLMPTLLQAWDAPNVMETITRANAARAERPFLSLIACIQPEILATEFGGEDSDSGLTSRFLYFCGQGKGTPMPDPPAPDANGMRLLYRELVELRDVIRPDRGLLIDEGSRRVWAAWYARDYRRTVSNAAEDRMRTRLAAQAKRIALIYAASEGDTHVRPEHLTAALALVEWQWGEVTKIAADWGASSGVALERRITQTLGNGPMPLWRLRQAVEGPRWDIEAFDRVTRSMLSVGTMLKDAMGTVALQGGDA
jgi:hypothetical protein